MTRPNHSHTDNNDMVLTFMGIHRDFRKGAGLMRKKTRGQSRDKEGRRGCAPGPEASGPATDSERGVPAGTLYVVATPIGHLEDITLRAIRILKAVSLIAAEDTRHTRILLERHQIATPLTSLHDQNERKKSNILLARLERGEDIAYVSDAGTPGVSDPGFVLVRNALAKGIRVAPVPGASAMIAALSVSGLPMDRFVFLGFLPAKPIRRRQALESLQREERTLVFYESPRRLLSTLRDIEGVFGEREVVVAREMTKMYEEFLRGPAGRIIAALASAVIRGEVTLIVAGRSEREEDFSDEDLLAQARQRGKAEGKGLSLRDMADRIAEETGVARRRIYRLLLSERGLRGCSH